MASRLTRSSARIAPTCFGSLQVLSTVFDKMLDIPSTIVDTLSINAPNFRYKIHLSIALLLILLLAIPVFTL